MNWIVFLITAYVLLSVQGGLAVAWEVGGVTPNLMLILAVFVGVSASRPTVFGALLLIGLLLDVQPAAMSAGGLIVGPRALGYLAGAYVVLQLRNLLFRESVVTIVVLVVAVGGFAALVETAVLALRGLPWLADQPPPAAPSAQLWRQAKALLYTAVVAVPLGLVLHGSRRLWGFGGRPRGDRGY